MGAAAKRSELKRAAQILDVTSTTLRQRGWKTASGARIQAVTEDPPDWLIAARENQRRGAEPPSNRGVARFRAPRAA